MLKRNLFFLFPKAAPSSFRILQGDRVRFQNKHRIGSSTTQL